MNRFILTDRIPDKVILTDDPLRVKMLVAHHLDQAQLLFEQRGMIGYIGSYRGIAIAIISCGFGGTAAELYAAEAAALGARELIYLGECVSLTQTIGIGEVVLALGGSEALLTRAGRVDRGIPGVPQAVRTLTVHTDDRFWLTSAACIQSAVDFTSAGLYRLAQTLDLAALAILTVSENMETQTRIDDAVRQSGFHSAAALAFEILAS